MSYQKFDLATGEALSQSRSMEFNVNGLMGLYRGRQDGRLKCENDRYNFVLNEKSEGGWELRHFGFNKGAGKYKIDFRGSVTDKNNETLGSSPSQIAVSYTCRGLLIQATWLPAMFEATTFKLVGVSWVDEQKKDLVRVDFEYEPANTRNNPVRNGYAILDPSRYWLIKRLEVAGYEASPELRIRIQTDNEFDDSIQGFPYVTKYVHKTRAGSGHEYEDRCTTKLRKIEESDLAAFSLESYGIAVPTEEFDPHRLP